MDLAQRNKGASTHPESITSALSPKFHQGPDSLTNFRVVPVEVGLLVEV